MPTSCLQRSRLENMKRSRRNINESAQFRSNWSTYKVSLVADFVNFTLLFDEQLQMSTFCPYIVARDQHEQLLGKL